VGSANRPKIAAARAALRPFAPQARVSGAEADSGVPEQPVGFEEITLGAGNRARAALAGGGDLGIGLEDGLVEVTWAAGWHRGDSNPRPRDLLSMAHHWNIGCAVVTDGVRTGLGFSSGFAYPPELTEQAVRDRAPIGALFDRLWQERRRGVPGPASGRGIGNVGKLSGGVLTRQEYGRHAVICALVRFLHPDLYGDVGNDEVPA
jgi:inosine/xanthosine triphosphatase